jgi:hypothetical protein
MTRCSTVLATILTIAIAAPSPAIAAPAAKSRQKRAAKPNKRATLLAEALAAAREQRAEVVAEARALSRGDDPRRGAARLAEAAVELDDPALTVEAAAAYHELRTKESSLAALRLVSAAREQLAALPDAEADASVDVLTVRVSRGEVEDLLARCAVLDEEATKLHQQILERERLERRGRKEIRVGAVLTSVGVAGLGVFIGGLAVNANRQDKLDAVRGEEQRYDLSGLDAQGLDDRVGRSGSGASRRRCHSERSGRGDAAIEGGVELAEVGAARGRSGRRRRGREVAPDGLAVRGEVVLVEAGERLGDEGAGGASTAAADAGAEVVDLVGGDEVEQEGVARHVVLDAVEVVAQVLAPGGAGRAAARGATGRSRRGCRR